MVHYYRQQQAFDALQEKQQSVFQNQTHGQRYYVVCTNREYWDKYLKPGDRFGYEVIRRDLPCHLYIDLDIDKIKYPSICVSDVWAKLEKYIDTVLTSEFGIDEGIITKRIHYSTGTKKGSMHIIYNIKDKMFRSSAHCGAFMRGIHRYVEIMKEEDMVMFDEKWVDMSIYTPNRLFRMLGCTKYGEDRRLVNNNEYTYEEWVTNKVQPPHYEGDFMGIREIDGSEPKYRCGGGGGITGWQPDCMKAILSQIEEKHAKPTRVHAFPMKSIFVCNLDTKVCPFKGESHSRNVLYANVKLLEGGYRIKCHSSKCKNKETKLYMFDDSVQESVNLFLDQPTCIPAIRCEK